MKFWLWLDSYGDYRLFNKEPTLERFCNGYSSFWICPELQIYEFCGSDFDRLFPDLVKPVLNEVMPITINIKNIPFRKRGYVKVTIWEDGEED